MSTLILTRAAVNKTPRWASLARLGTITSWYLDRCGEMDDARIASDSQQPMARHLSRAVQLLFKLLAELQCAIARRSAAYLRPRSET